MIYTPTHTLNHIHTWPPEAAGPLGPPLQEKGPELVGDFDYTKSKSEREKDWGGTHWQAPRS